MVRRIPVITSDCGAPEEIVKDGINGYIFPTSDDKALARRMVQFVSNPGLVEDFSRRIEPEKIITVQKQAGELALLYRQIIDSWRVSDHA
jgi:glycosyltransferase involved in cell wall biosynthesis